MTVKTADAASGSPAAPASGRGSPRAGTVEQLSQLAPLLDEDKDRIDVALKKAPLNYRKLIRLGTMGATIPYYLCGAWLRGTDLQGKTVVAPWFQSHAGRCTEPDA